MQASGTYCIANVGSYNEPGEHLERQSVNCLMPTIALEKIIRGKRTMVSEPLFPNYLFIEFDPEVIHTTTISATRGVNNFVRFGALPAIVPSAVIHQLSIYKPEGITDPETPHEGDSVLITDGAFEGLGGDLHRARRRSALYVAVKPAE